MDGDRGNCRKESLSNGVFPHGIALFVSDVISSNRRFGRQNAGDVERRKSGFAREL